MATRHEHKNIQSRTTKKQYEIDEFISPIIAVIDIVVVKTVGRLHV